MNSAFCAVIAYCFVILAINSVTGLQGGELYTAFRSLQSSSTGNLDGPSLQHLKDSISRSSSAGSLNSISPQDLKNLIIWSGYTGGFDRLSPQDLKDLNSWISSPGISNGLSSQQLMDLVCSGAGVVGKVNETVNDGSNGSCEAAVHALSTYLNSGKGKLSLPES